MNYFLLAVKQRPMNDILDIQLYPWDRRGRDRMVVGFTTTYAISVHHYKRC